MGKYYKNQYRTESLRLQNWDYSQKGTYFITICTQHHVTCFGAIDNGRVKLSSLGIIADVLWYEIKHHAKNVNLAEFVVMPNHVHGILVLGDSNGNTNINVNTNVETRHALSLQSQPKSQLQPHQTGQHQNQNQSHKPINVETRHALSLQMQSNSQSQQHQTGQQRFQNQGKNTISSIVGSYKSAVSKHAHRLGFDFQWQRNFWEHIIRNTDEYKRIAQYIIDNPAKWENDKLNNGVGNSVMETAVPYNNEVWML